jgi:hypothetical protein
LCARFIAEEAGNYPVFLEGRTYTSTTVFDFGDLHYFGDQHRILSDQHEFSHGYSSLSEKQIVLDLKPKRYFSLRFTLSRIAEMEATQPWTTFILHLLDRTPRWELPSGKIPRKRRFFPSEISVGPGALLVDLLSSNNHRLSGILTALLPRRLDSRLVVVRRDTHGELILMVVLAGYRH